MPRTRVTNSRLPLTADEGVDPLDLDRGNGSVPTTTPTARFFQSESTRTGTGMSSSKLRIHKTESIKSILPWSSTSNSSSRRQARSYPELKIKINSGNGTPWEGSTSSPLSSSTNNNSSTSTTAEPFNLISFFPIHTPTEMRSGGGEDSAGYGFGGGREWNWLNEDRSVNSEDFSGTGTETETEYEFDEMGGLVENEDKIRKIGIADVAGQVIDGEDKFGILGLTSGNITKILLESIIGRFLGKMGDFGGGERRVVVNEDYEPEDIEEQQQHHLQQQHLPHQLAPPHHPSPLPIDESIEHISMPHNHNPRNNEDDRRVPHDHASRSSYSNSPATLSHHERPSVDPTTLRSLIINDWRVDQQQQSHHQQVRNGNGDRDHRDSQPSSNKRKLEESQDELQSKIRRIVRDHLTMDYARVMSMTTVVCLHAAVAQKSYGSEKRFLCPPPIVRIETPYSELKNQHLAMSIVTESGERGPEQRSPLDNNMIASFKYLHVSGTAKSKSFQLALDVSEPSIPHVNPDTPSTSTAVASHESSIPGRIWASFDSAPVTIISKPSKKTAKTRNISSCILAGGPVSLFNRINSQTVRTKYMTIEHTQLCASNLSWSAFNVNVVRRPHDLMLANQTLQSSSSQSHPNQHPNLPSPLPVIYGCEIQLVDTLTGIATSPLIIRKVDKGKVSPEDGGPVSQMQKIALQRVNPDGSRSYLSAASPTAANGVGVGLPNASGSQAPPPPTPGSAGQPASHPLVFQQPHVKDEIRDGVRVVTDEVDDYLCWTIVGISKFQYTFFDGTGTNTPVPRLPITPFPTLFTTPGYRAATHTIELTVSNFFYTHPDSMQHTPLEVWLGPIGPLRQRIFQATPPGPLTSIGMNGLGPGLGVPGKSLNNPGIAGLNGLTGLATLNGMDVSMGGMLNMGMPYGQPPQHGDGSNNGNNNGSDGSPTGGQQDGQNQTQTTPSSQPPTPSTAGPSASTSNPTTIPLPGQQASPGSVHSLIHPIPPPSHPPPHSPPVAPPRFVPQGPLHTIIIVDLPPVAQIVRSARESVGLPAHAGYMGEGMSGIPGMEMGISLGGGQGSNGESNSGDKHGHGHPPPPPPPLPTLPILFIRTYDGVGYHSGRSIACEPNLGPGEIERIRRGIPNHTAAANASGNGSGPSGSNGANGSASSNSNSGRNGDKGDGGGSALENDIDWSGIPDVFVLIKLSLEYEYEYESR
ncbi:hypothetical protein Clacol_003096 [Clathrus columnatus]|uniref:Uncharacterized protein n=1 Tax=Clathrus columnatus TaxID=1419009 RepID=A0AAV5A793_9AGAM|nr:hypothetical protein Clacol_003096 [Clathrus columnatus]